jgi:lipid-binding SYLF domain-containing protein
MVIAALLATMTLPLRASDREDNHARLRAADRVFQEIMKTPDKAIPEELLESAKCIAIVPGQKKFAFMVGGEYGKGVAVCRTAHGWSAPMFLSVGGGSYGLQIGGSSTDVVMLFLNDHALESLLSDKFKIGADATVAAGPVGRHVAAGTDIKLNAEILTWSRSKGVFAGVSLNGAVVQEDESGNRAAYGDTVRRQEILRGEVPAPAEARGLLAELNKYASAQTGTAAISK